VGGGGQNIWEDPNYTFASKQRSPIVNIIRGLITEAIGKQKERKMGCGGGRKRKGKCLCQPLKRKIKKKHVHKKPVGEKKVERRKGGSQNFLWKLD